SGPSVDVSFLHALPEDADFARVDVFMGDRRIFRSVVPGRLRETSLPAGSHQIRILPAGSTVASTSLLPPQRFRLRANSNITIALHTTANNEATVTSFRNKTRTVGRDMGRLTIRNLTRQPKLLVRSQGDALMDTVTSGEQGMVGLLAGKYPLVIASQGNSRDALKRLSVKIRNKPGRSDMGNNVIVHLWGGSGGEPIRATMHEVQLDLT
ncbi:MAG: DUF4397 domain-containing protein, partial [Actinomycetota bacterium]